MNQNPFSRAVRPCILLLAFFSCGFTWGGGGKDQCDEARTVGEAVSPETASAERDLAAQKVQKLCPEGGAGEYLKGVALEAGQNPEQAMEAYRAAGRKDPLLADAKGRLGLLLFARGAREEASVALFEALRLKQKPEYARTLA